MTLRAAMARVGLIFLSLLMVACDAMLPAPADRAAGLSTEITPLPTENRRIWGLTVADFDADGDEDVLVAGHGGKFRDRIYYYQGDGLYSPGDFDFPPAPDRHGCAAADVDADGDVDVYCTAGAERGEGRNNNELLLANADGGTFVRSREDFGARDPYGRGRLVRFMNADGNKTPDLYATVWGPRSDQQLNSSSVFENVKGAFQRKDSAASGPWGGRCLAVADFGTKGVDDLVVCHADEGATLLRNQGAYEFQSLPLPDAEDWWLDVATGGLDKTDGADLAALVLDGKGGSIQIFGGADLGAGTTTVLKRIPLRKLPRSLARRCIPNAIAVGDASGDGHPDLFVTRVHHNSRREACKDVEDIIVLGPTYDRYVTVAAPANGSRSQVYAANGHFLRLTAGEGWTGGVELVRLVPGE